MTKFRAQINAYSAERAEMYRKLTAKYRLSKFIERAVERFCATDEGREVYLMMIADGDESAGVVTTPVVSSRQAPLDQPGVASSSVEHPRQEPAPADLAKTPSSPALSGHEEKCPDVAVSEDTEPVGKVDIQSLLGGMLAPSPKS